MFQLGALVMGQERVPQGVDCPEQSAVATGPVIHLARSLLAGCPWKHELTPEVNH